MSQFNVFFKDSIDFLFYWCFSFWSHVWRDTSVVGLFLRNGLDVRNAVAVNSNSI